MNGQQGAPAGDAGNGGTRAAGYVRVSQERNVDRQGLGAQEVDVRRHVEYMRWELVELYCEEGVSGYKRERPALERMLADAAAGDAPLVIRPPRARDEPRGDREPREERRRRRHRLRPAELLPLSPAHLGGRDDVEARGDGALAPVRVAGRDDGVPVWTFKAAPRDLLVSVYGQLESVWPVHGSILVHKGDLVFTAGRSTYLDDGLRFYRLDARAGKVLARSQVVHIDPKTGKQTGTERFRERSTGFHMEGASTDIMSSLGDSVYLKYMQFDRDGKEIPKTGDHLYAMTSMLAEEWFVRTYWFYGGKYGGGWGGWSYAGRYPSGRIMVIDGDGIFGYGRATIGGGPTGHKADVYHLYKHGGWSDKASPIVRAMVKAGDKIVVAGPVDLRRKSPRMLAYANEEEALASFAGKKGVVMRVVNAADGKVLSETALDAVPAFDGMSAADGKVFMGLKNGEVQCWE